MKNNYLFSIRSFSHLLFAIAIVLTSGLWNKSMGQVSTYTKSITSGTYTAHTGTSILSAQDDLNSSATDIGFSFVYNGTTYTQFVANSNGFIKLGSTAPTAATYTAISSETNVISAANADGKITGDVRVQTQGSAPNRVCNIQYTNYDLVYNATTRRVSFQIQLYESTNVIDIIYTGATGNTTTKAIYVGLTGSATSDFSNYSGSNANWAALPAGSANTNTVSWGSNQNGTRSMPANGRILRWTPLTATCPTSPSPATAATGVSQLTTLSWTAGSNSSTYDVYLSTTQSDVDNQLAGAKVSSNQSGTSYTPTLSASTTYYWRVVPKSAHGMSPSGCTTWSFTTSAPSPTLTVSSLSAFGNQCVSTTSAAGTFNVSGINLTGNVSIAALTGYSYCLTSGGTYTSTLSITASGTLASTPVYVKFTPSSATTFNGNIVVSSSGATSQNVAASGTGVNTSISTQPSSSAATYCSGVTATALTIAATSANGSAFTYQWYSNTTSSTSGGTAVGTSSTSYTPSTSSAGTLYYYCVVSGCGASATSNVSGAITTSSCIIMSNGSTTLSGSTNFYDSGGSGGNYSNNETYTYTVYPSSCNNVKVTFASFNTEATYDYLYVYNGNSTSAAQVTGSPFNGTSLPSAITSSATDGSLTFKFTSDGSTTPAGWDATLSLVAVSSGPATPTGFTGTLNPEVGATETYSVTNISGVTYTWSFPSGWVINSGQGTNSVSVTVGSVNGTISCTPSKCGYSGTAYSTTTTIPSYRWKYVSSDLGPLTWTGGETRSLDITIKNTGTSTWNSGGSPTITNNIGVRWNSTTGSLSGSPWSDYHSRTSVGTLAPGSTATYSLSIDAKNATAGPTYGTNLSDGTYYLAFDLVTEGCFWFSNNPGTNTCNTLSNTCSGNTVFYSPAQTITSTPTIAVGSLTAFGSVCLSSTATNSFVLSGVNLTNDISIASLTGYTYSLSASGPFTSTLTVTQSGGIVDETVYVKFSPTAVTTYSGNIVCSSTGATSKNVAASGTGFGPTSVSAGYDKVICSGQSTTLNGTGGGAISSTASTTYTSGAGSTLYSSSTPTTSSTSSCPIPVSVSIPSGAVITGVNVAYSMTASSANSAWKSEQYSYLKCTSSGGTSETSISQGSGSAAGTQTYSRTGLSIANSVTGGGTINFELHAFRTYGGSGCNTTYNQVDNSTLIVTVSYTLPVTYSWSPTTALSSSTVAAPTASPTSNTTYTLSATMNGCTVSDAVAVTINSIPAATAANNSPVCAGSSVGLTANNMAPSGQAISLNNTSGQYVTGNTYSSDLDNHTIEFWVKPSRTVVLHSETNTGVSGNLAAPTTEYNFAITPNHGGATNAGIGVSVGTNGIEVIQHGDSHFPVTLSYTAAISSSNWTHVAVVHNSNVPYLYVNGNLVDIGQSSLKPTFPGSSVGYAYGYYGGEIDNIRVWNTVRTATNIIDNMYLETPVSTSGLLNNLPFNGDGTALTGSSVTVSGTYTTPTYYTYTWSGTSAPTASTSQTQTSGAIASGGNYTVVASTATCSGNASSATTITISNPTVSTTLSANDYVWTGASSSVWNLTANWLQWNGSTYSFPSSYPNASSANVILPTDNASGGTCVPNEARIGNVTISVNNMTTESLHAFQLNNGNARLNIYGALTLGGTWSTPSAGAIVDYAGSGSQTILATTYSNLQTSGSGTKTLSGTTTVNLVVTVGSGTTLDLSNKTLRLVNSTSTPIVNNGTWNENTSTVDFRSASDQTIPALTYYNLFTNGLNTGGIKTLNGNVSVTNTLTINDGTTLVLGANTLSMSGASPFAYGSLANGTVSIGTSDIQFTRAGDQTLPGFSYYNLTTNGSGLKNLSAATTVSNNLNLIAGTLTVGANTLTYNGTNITRTSGSIDASNASATLAFGNSSLLTLPASVFSTAVNNMTLNNARVLASSDFTINGILNLNNTNPDATNGLLDLVQSYGSYANVHSNNSTDSYNDLNSVVLTLGSSATLTGAGDVTGKIRRTSFSDGNTYAFGNPNMRLTFNQNGGTMPSQITVVATKGAEGLHVDKDDDSDNTSNPLIGGKAVKRMHQILRTGGSNDVRFTVRFPYDDSELNGNTESNLVTWDHHLPYAGMTPHEHGKTNINTSENWVELSNHGLFYLAQEGDASFTKYWMLSNKVSTDTLWLGAAGGTSGTDWSTSINWSSGAVPSSITKVVVDPTIYNNQLTITGTPQAGTMYIKSGAIVNGGSATLTLNGGPAINGGSGTWVNEGTFNAGTSTIIFNNSDATLAGNTEFYNLTVNTGKKLTIQADANDSISGTLTVNGTLDATANQNTIIFTGSDQAIHNPNGVITGFSNLTISQASGTATAAEDLSVIGNLLVSTSLDMNSYNLNIEGNLENNSSISNVPTVSMLGSSTQTIEGTSPLIFNDLLILGTSGSTVVNNDVTINGILYVESSKTLNGGSNTIELTGSGTPFILDGSYSGANGTVFYNSSDAQDILPLNYYNLKSAGSTTKVLMDNTTVSNKLTLDGTMLDAQTYTLTIAGSGTNSPSLSNGGILDVSSGTLNLANNGGLLTFPSSFFNGNVNNLTLSGTGGAKLTNDFTITGALTLDEGSLDIDSHFLTIDTDGSMSKTNGWLVTGSGGLIFKAATLDATALLSNQINNLEIDRASGVTVNGDIEILNDFTMTDGSLDIGTSELKLSGTFNHTSGSIDASAGKVHFNMTGATTLPTGFFTGDVSELKLSNGSLILSEEVRVKDALTLNAGDLVTDDTKMLTIGTGVSNPGVVNWTTGTVVGPMKRWFGASTNSSLASGVFPVGKSGLNRYAQVNFTSAPSSGGYIIAKFVDGMQSDSYATVPLTYSEGGRNYYIQNTDQEGYWDITPYSASGTPYGSLDDVAYTLKLRINSPTSVQNGGILANPPRVRLIRAKGNPDGSHNSWSLAGTYNTIETLAAGSDYVVTSVNVTGFSWFNGGGDNSNPLPVELLSFTGECTEEGNKITWSTASENNSAYFEVQASRDGENWKVATTKPAAGYSLQKLTYEFTDVNAKGAEMMYYRLRQVDVNNDEKMYDPILIGCGNTTDFIKTYPNPSGNAFNVLVSNKSLVGTSTLKMIDTKGTVVATKVVDVVDGVNLFTIDENVSPGMYYISISNGTSTTKVLKHSIK